MYYNFNLRHNSLIGTELLFIQVEGKSHSEVPTTVSVPSGNSQQGTTVVDLWRHISYLGIPIYCGINIKKLKINLGVQTSFALMSSGRTKLQEPDGYGATITTTGTYNKLYIDSYDFGVRVGVIYCFTERFAIEGSYYHGLNNINIVNIPDWYLKVRQMTLGARFRLFTSANKTKNDEQNK